MPVAHVFTLIADDPIVLQINDGTRHAALKNDISAIREIVSEIPSMAPGTEWSDFSWADVTHVMVQGGTFPQDEDDVNAVVYNVACHE